MLKAAKNRNSGQYPKGRRLCLRIFFIVGRMFFLFLKLSGHKRHRGHKIGVKERLELYVKGFFNCWG